MGMVELHDFADTAEASHIHALLVRHHQYTDSPSPGASSITGTTLASKFVKVMPTEYRQVLERQLNMKSDMSGSRQFKRCSAIANG